MGRHALPIAGLTVLGAILRFATLDLQSFGHDEAVTVFEVLQPGLADTVAAVIEDKEKSPPLYYVLAWAWTEIFGLGEIGVRSLSALLGTLTIPVAYLAARELASRRAGLVAAALVALNPYLIWFSQEARAYSLFILLSALTLLFLARALRRASGRDLALWAVTAAASFATHYFTTFLVVPEALYLLYRLRSGRALAAVAVAAAGAAAVAPIALMQNSGRPGVLADTSLGERVLRTVTSFSSGDQLALLPAASGVHLVSAVVGLAAATLAGLGIRLAFARGRAQERRGALLAGALGSLAFLIPVVAALAGADLVNPRSMVVAVTPLLIAAAIGFAAQRSG
ncbi:MAG: glycosyltransferase family 39 protein, partial [Thermoleophilaceae bacterium]|nr:glycosyltransferase family 39 protein [Thermoleophilaceae bacterium]